MAQKNPKYDLPSFGATTKAKPAAPVKPAGSVFKPSVFAPKRGK